MTEADSTLRVFAQIANNCSPMFIRSRYLLLNADQCVCDRNAKSFSVSSRP
jgi:hypothetical protein